MGPAFSTSLQPLPQALGNCTVGGDPATRSRAATLLRLLPPHRAGTRTSQPDRPSS